MKKSNQFNLVTGLILFFGHIANAQTYMVSTVVGNGTAALVDSIGTLAECNSPYSVKSDGANTIYFADVQNHAIRKYDINTHKVTTIAGNGTAGFQDGACATALFNYPEGVFYKNGFLYVGDNANNRIRKIDLSLNIVSTIAGSGIQGYLDGSVSTAKFYQPKYLIVDNSNNVFVADYENHCIRKISGGQVTTIAGIGGVSGYQNGPGSSAKFYRPADLCMDTTNGNIYVTDIMNNVIRKIDASYNVTTFAGNTVSGNMDGSATTAEFTRPTAIDITCSNQYLYVADGLGGDNIRKISVSTGVVSTVAGIFSVAGWQDGVGTSAKFNQIQGLCFDPHGALYVGDAYNNRIRKIIVPEGNGANLCGTAGIAEYSNEQTNLNAYPNPNTGIVNVQINNATEISTYKVFNVVGSEVKAGNLTYTDNKIDLQNLPNGIYTLVVSQKDLPAGEAVKISKTKISLLR